MSPTIYVVLAAGLAIGVPLAIGAFLIGATIHALSSGKVTIGNVWLWPTLGGILLAAGWSAIFLASQVTL